MKERVETFLKEFEWTWTTAVLASLGLTFIMLISAVIVPSFIIYFSEQQFGWAGATDLEGFINELVSDGPFNPEMMKEVRDAVAMGVTTVAFAMPFVIATILQNKRRKLRGGSDKRPTGGYR
ncbi:MAG: hypothetical protein WD004_02480 [Actinomycetota bacterium]